MKAKHRVLTGKFGRLTIVGFHGRDTRGKDLWDCVCDCGTKKVCRGDHLLSGVTKSCGCLNRERAVETGRMRGKANVKHGGEGTRLYRIWCRMKERCYNPAHVHYSNYGGKGIDVCLEWRSSFSNFKYWAEQSGYTDRLSIDRIDSSKGYAPDNCRWATAKEQGRNRKDNRIIKGKCLCEWIESACVSETTVRKRLKKGWPIEKACHTPAGGPTNVV